MRLIPGKTSVQIRLFKNISLMDMIMAGIGVLLITLTVLTPFTWRYMAAGVVLVLFVVLLFRLDTEPVYIFVYKLFRFAVSKKKYGKAKGLTDIGTLMAFTDVEEDVINYGGKYFGAVIEISPVEFRFFSEIRRKTSIENSLGAILRSVHVEQGVNIVKLEKPISYEAYIQEEYKRIDALKQTYEHAMMSEQELQIREEVIYERINELSGMMSDQKVVEAFYYLVMFDADRRQLEQASTTAMQLLSQGEMPAKRVRGADLTAFLRYTNDLDFDEREIGKPVTVTEKGQETEEEFDALEFATPDKIVFRSRNAKIGKMIAHHFVISGYPSMVDDAWMATVMSIPSTKVVIKCTPTDQLKTVRSIDRSIQELSSQYESTGVTSRKIELKSHIDSLTSLLVTLQDQNEALMDVNIYVTAYDRQLAETISPDYAGVSARRLIASMKQTVKRMYREEGLKLNGMEFDQLIGFIGSQVSGYDPLKKESWSMPTNSIAASYPWVFAHIEDKKGLKYGSHDGVPVMIDFFQRNSERVNSNMVIVGKSGSGKSYATKSILANLAAEDSKIFVLDPENEYTELADNLHGKFINVGNALQGRLNPFHIMTELEDDEDETDAVTGSYSMHMQFLEEFYRQILPDCDRDALEYLNLLTDRMYINRGITAETNLAKLRPTDYPTFDDLYDEILKEFQTSDNEYIHTMLRTLINYISKFASGGRNASIWNGPSSVTTDENFTVFNFQSLLSNRNQSIANAQMLLVLKYIDHEIIKNREYNIRLHKDRKVVVVIDEAHVFIDEKYPIALDFMFQLAKRIRKYNGMQIVITQNIKDFVGSEELARKSAAIINACQYSLIFSLAPNDMEDLCLLYDKAGGINAKEQEEIVSAPRGQAFLVMGASKRATVQIEATDLVREAFELQHFRTHYFAEEEDRKAWEDYIFESRVKREAEKVFKVVEDETQEENVSAHVKVVDIDEDYLAEDESIAETTENVEVSAAESVKTADMSDADMESAIRRLEAVEAAMASSQPVKTAEVQTAPAPAAEFVHTAGQASQPATVFVKPEGFDSMMAQLTSLVENMGRFSYEAMREEMLRMINEQTAGARMAALAASAVPETSAAPDTSEAVDLPLGDETSDSDFDINSLLGLGDSSTETSTDSDTADEAPYFDIMALLAQESANLSNTLLIEEMIEENEMVFEVTLDDLIAYNQKHN